MTRPVKVAVVPCAGMGTRLRPLTRVVPKELLPYGNRPLIEHLLEELRDAGIERAVIVIRQEKEILRRHLDCGGIPSGLRVEYAEQAHPQGLADALRAAKKAVAVEPFLMALPDQLLLGAAGQLLPSYSGQASLSSRVTVPPQELQFFPGTVAVEVDREPVGRVLSMRAGSDSDSIRAFGRTVFHPDFLNLIPESTDETDFGKLIATYLQQGLHEAALLQGDPVDLGILAGYLHYQKEWRAAE